MIKLGTISVLLSLLFQVRVTDAKDVHPPVGQAYFIAETDLLGEELIGGATVVILSKEDCFVCNKSEIIDDDSTYFKNTETFYSSIAENYKLGAALKRDFTLGFTLDQTTKSISQSNRTVKGCTLNVLSKVGHCLVKPECIYDESYHQLSEHFISEFERLPRHVEEIYPEGFNFSAYEHFLNEFGSHVVTGVTYGSRMYQHCFSQSEQDYSVRDYNVRACVAFSGGTDVTKINISTCAGITQEEAEASSSLEVSTRLVIRGGTKETRAKLYAERTNELIAQFLAEASWEEPIEYSFTAVWTLLGQRYIGTQHYAKVRHLEGYYLGLKNFGCPEIMGSRPDGSGVAMQGFARTDYSTADVPSYECYIPYSGCHDSDDCHYGPGVYCKCHGYTCFHDKTLTLNTGEQRLSVYPYWGTDWFWQGCDLGVFYCHCDFSQYDRWRTIWEQDKDGADNGKMLRAMHSKMQSMYRHAAASAPKESKNSKEEL